MNKRVIGIFNIFSLIITLFPAKSIVYSQQTGENLFINGGFETGNAEPTVRSLNAIEDFEVTAEESHSGKYSLKISNRKDVSCNWGQSVKVEKGKMYIFSAYAMPAPTASQDEFWSDLYFYEGREALETVAGIAGQMPMKKGEWTKYTRVVKATDNDNVFPSLAMWTLGDYYIDDVYFGEYVPGKLKLDIDENIMIPQYSEKSVLLKASLKNQTGSENLDISNVNLSLNKSSNGVSLSDNVLKITDEAEVGQIEITAETEFEGQVISQIFLINLVKEWNYDYQSDNLFKNGDFETCTISPTKLNRYSAAELELSATEKHGGDYSLKIKNRKDESCGWGQDIEVKKDKVYIFDGFLKVSDSAKSSDFPCGLYFFNEGSFKKVAGVGNTIIQKESGWRWTRVTSVVKALEDAETFLCPVLWKNSSTEVADYYADDLYFSELKICDIKNDEFEHEINIPDIGDIAVQLSGKALNQIETTLGIPDNIVEYRLKGEYSGICIENNVLKISKDALPGSVEITASFNPAFNDLPIFEKDFRIILKKTENQNDYTMYGAWERADGKIRFDARITKNSKETQNVSLIVAAYDEKERLTDVSIMNVDSESVASEGLYGDKCKVFLWERNNADLSMKPAKYDDISENQDTVCVYVSPNGDDQNSGSLSEPLQTVNAAKNKIRELNLTEKGKKLNVILREGEYRERLILGSVDSGKNGNVITYKAYPDERPVFTGAKQIKRTDLKKLTDSERLKRIPEDARDSICYVSLSDYEISDDSKRPWYGRFSYLAENLNKNENISYTPNELFCDDTAMRIARYPNVDNLTVESVLDTGSNGFTDSAATYRPFAIKVDDERIKSWTNAENALMYGHWKYLWANQSVPIASIEDDIITSKYPAAFGVDEECDFYVYNLIEELDSPGEYYIDDGILYIYPSQGNGDFELSTEKQPLISIDSCKNITIDGIRMKNTSSNAIFCSDAENVYIKNCEIYNTADYAIEMSGKNSGIENCYLHDVDGGINISGGDRKTLTSANLYVNNCEIKNFSRLTKTYTPGIYAHGVGLNITNNELHGSEHLAIEWFGNNNTFAYNEIYDVCLNADDAGAIYAGKDPVAFGNEFMYNYIHDIGAKEYTDRNVYGIYMDDGQYGGHIYGNIFENITGDGIHHAGRESVIENNVFINMKKSVFYSYRDGTALVQNLPEYYDSKIWTDTFANAKNIKLYMTKDGWNKGHILKNNVLVNTASMWCNDLRIGTQNVSEYITCEDPGFWDYKNGKYNFKSDSVVFELLPEFKDIPFDEIGKRG